MVIKIDRNRKPVHTTLRVAEKVVSKLVEKGDMLPDESVAEIENILLSALEALTSKTRCATACVTSSIHGNRCIVCYRRVE